MTLTKPRYNGTITFPDAGLEGPIGTARGAVLISGTSPNAKVTLINLDSSSGTEPIDVMQKVKIEQDGDRLVLTGRSLHAINVLKLRGDDTIVTAVVDTKRCKNCPG